MMQRSLPSWILVALLSAGFVANLGLYAAMGRVDANLTATRTASMQTITVEWLSEGASVTVTTPRLSFGDPVEEWAARHRAAVDAMEAEFPQD